MFILSKLKDTCHYFQNECLNSDGQQFHLYQQNEQSRLVLFYWTQKKDQRYMTLEIQALASRKSGRVNPFTIPKKNTKVNYWDI